MKYMIEVYGVSAVATIDGKAERRRSYSGRTLDGTGQESFVLSRV